MIYCWYIVDILLIYCWYILRHSIKGYYWEIKSSLVLVADSSLAGQWPQLLEILRSSTHHQSQASWRGCPNVFTFLDDFGGWFQGFLQNSRHQELLVFITRIYMYHITSSKISWSILQHGKVRKGQCSRGSWAVRCPAYINAKVETFDTGVSAWMLHFLTI